MAKLKLVPKETLYQTDFYAWTEQQALLLHKKSYTVIDLENIIEEIETLGRNDYKSLVSAYRLLLMHLLKWQFQPQFRGSSWQKTIKEQRRSISRQERDSPSLRSKYSEIIAKAYEDAVEDASDETGLPLSSFPATCPYSVEQIRDLEFYP